MIYEWKCKKCKSTAEVTRAVIDYMKPPTCGCACPKGEEEWRKVIMTAPPVPFEHLRQSGEFADEHGNFAPRKL